MIKHLLNYFLFLGTVFAAGAPAVGGGNGSTTGSGGGAPTGGAPAGDGQGGQPTGGGTQGGAPVTGSQSGQGGQVDNLRQLRETYENLKRDFEPWQRLGVKPEQVSQFQGVYQKVYDEAAAIGRELGYPDQEIAEALAEDPIRCIEFLRNQMAETEESRQQPGQQDLNTLIRQGIEQAMGPIQYRQNLQQTNEANALFERTVHKMALDAFKAEGVTDPAQIPQDEMQFLMQAASEILKYDDAAMRALKYEGKTAGIQQAFQEAKNLLDKYYVSRSGRERTRIQPGRPGQPAVQSDNGKKPSLDDIIDGNDIATRAMASLRQR